MKLGYGSLNQVKEMNAREVIQALNYDRFLSDYEGAYLEMHK